MTLPLEILVHVSAPSRGSDDARYRKQALGYLGFEAARRHEVFGGSHEDERPAKRLRTTIDGENPQERGTSLKLSRQEIAGSSQLFSEECEEGFGFPSLGSSFDETSSPLLTKAFLNNDLTTSSEYSPFPTLYTTSSTTIQIRRTPQLNRPQTAPTPSPRSPRSSLPQRSFSDSWEIPPSVIPDSQPSYTSAEHRLLIDTTEPPSITLTSSPSPPKRQGINSPIPSTQPFHEDINPTLRTHHPTPKSSDLSGHDSPHPPSLLSSPAPPPKTNHIPQPPTFQIYPPPPPTSLRTYTTHLTPSLVHLATNIPLAKYFQPLLQKRPLRPLERGCWIIPLHDLDEQEQEQDARTSIANKVPPAHAAAADAYKHQSRQEPQTPASQPLTLRTRFQHFLEVFIGSGKAGWGVWCSWEGVETVPPPPSFSDNDKNNNNLSTNDDVPAREFVKVYCWGEVVAHVYLVLFLASERRIRGMGARWVDARGDAVVRMA
ncbi:hypothetical protein MMC06_001809 [Schaereria dolodes]|nr:hypothetical protein [Schaereria dolodes]